VAVINQEDIPQDLWKNETLHMPICLIEAYRKQLQKYGVMNDVLDTKNMGGPIGGSSHQDTLQHFTYRYGVSACRVQSLALDPYHAFDSIPDDLLTTLSAGRVSILDMPCGTGAAGASLLSTIAILRDKNKLPREPLDVMITGGDCSPTGRVIYKKIIDNLKPYLATVGINIWLATVDWDGTNPDSTAALVDAWLNSNSPGCTEFLTVIANFSGAAGNHFADFERSFLHIHERLHDKTCTIIWVEPKMRSADTLLKRVRSLFNFRSGTPNSQFTHLYSFYHPFQLRSWNCSVSVCKYNRGDIQR